jgi:hypothetical protein
MQKGISRPVVILIIWIIITILIFIALVFSLNYQNRIPPPTSSPTMTAG